MKTVKTVHYCKADKKTGKPVIITDMVADTRTNVRKWSMLVKDYNTGKPIRIEVEFNNSFGKAKKQGATTILKILR